MARTRPTVYRRVRVDALQEGRRPGVCFALLILAIVLPAFGAGIAYVRLTSDQIRLKRQLSEMRRDFALRSKEQANLALEVEMFRNGSRILGQVQHLGLGLQMPQRGQVIRVGRAVAAPAGRRDLTVLAGR